MALTRSALREKGITDKEILDFIMEENGIGIEAAKEKAEEATQKAMQKTIDDLKGQLDSVTKTDPNAKDWKTEYDTLKMKYDTDISAKDTEFSNFKSGLTKREKARKWLIDKGMNSDVVDDFMLDKLDYSKMELDGDNVKGADDYFKPYQEQYAKYAAKIKIEGVEPGNPPASPGAVNPTAKTANDTMNNLIRGKGDN